MKTTLFVLFASMSLAMAVTACGDDACSAEESKTCSDKQATCVTSCGTGVEANYASCVATCNTRLCDCLDSCGSTCQD
ncbi:hypothetical protein HPC49_03340 [Pyxidicoccus fallax]|uniref:Lipoprotein n=1 Tax=Pyxidicoccus fallax TaxID=394095 RepID=A0A848LFF3_9BACT|nr:hypothetical protein [Pyxidicoccus fallax]NMO15753.1 hypothetical protein [Pyxidicoccus fallax]NPC77291.1 hypothetical protein [Pyxidicoccus fallax]